MIIYLRERQRSGEDETKFHRPRTQGFFIKKVDRGEADRIFTIYTEDFGKIEILGKAIRKIKSKLRGGTELFYLSEIEFIQGKTYKTLTDAVLINNFQNIRNDLERLRIAEQISENLDSLIKEQEPDQAIWQLLNEVFEKLNNYTLKPKTHTLIYYYFFWNFVSILGYQPELKNFIICEKKISADIFKILRIIFKKDLKTLLKLKLELFHQKSLKNISSKYFEYLLNEIN